MLKKHKKKKKIKHTLVDNSLFDTRLSLVIAILPLELLGSRHSTPSISGSNTLGDFEMMLSLSSISSTFCSSLEFKFVVISG